MNPKNKIFLFLLYCLFLGMNNGKAAVVDSVGVETIEGVRFIKHKVEAGETWYAIARKYGISYSELRMANRKEGDKLNIGQIVRIPGKAKPTDPRFQKNYIEDKPGKTETLKVEKPKQGSKLIHKVGAGETMFSISRKYGVSVDQIKSWNNLQGTTIHKNQELIVGMERSAPVKEEQVQLNKAPKESQNLPEAVITKKESDVIRDQEKSEGGTVLIKTAGKPEEKKYTFANGRKEVNEQGVASWIDDEDINPNKYYALHRNAPVGTIIKIVNRMNQKSIFVKVVGRLQETGDNEGLIIKVSKASAEKLGVLDRRFQADLTYGVADR